jgi:hypothetical protein
MFFGRPQGDKAIYPRIRGAFLKWQGLILPLCFSQTANSPNKKEKIFDSQ